jgi:hypothetical protein
LKLALKRWYYEKKDEKESSIKTDTTPEPAENKQKIDDLPNIPMCIKCEFSNYWLSDRLAKPTMWFILSLSDSKKSASYPSSFATAAAARLSPEVGWINLILSDCSNPF